MRSSRTLILTLMALVFPVLTAAAAQESDVPGTAPTASAFATAQVDVAQPAAPVAPIVTDSGLISLSVDAAGSNSSSGAVIEVEKPEGATVRSAFLAAASTGFTEYIPQDGDVQLDGVDVVWDPERTMENGIFSVNVWADVTSIVKSKLDAAPSGRVPFQVTEGGVTFLMDGSILAVIFDDPNATQESTVILAYGAQQVTGDRIQLVRTGDVNAEDVVVDLGIGISFGYQPTFQDNVVEVNGVRLTTSAGGQDDGEPANGALITVGGLDDLNDNPPDPFARGDQPTCPRCDDELYDLSGFVAEDTETLLELTTENPSADDNFFFAALSVSGAEATWIPSGGDLVFESVNREYGLAGEWELFRVVTDSPDDQIEFEFLSGPSSEGRFRPDTRCVNDQNRTCETGSDGILVWSYFTFPDRYGSLTVVYDEIRAWVDEDGDGEFDPGERSAVVEFPILEPISLVGLGDSYSSGEGAYDYFPETDTDDNKCHRARNAWSSYTTVGDRGPISVLEQYNSGVRWASLFAACSGARTFNVYTGDFPDPSEPQYNEPLQLDRLIFRGIGDPEFDDLDMVTMTIGGNDARFSAILTMCTLFNCIKEGFTTRTIPFILGGFESGVPFQPWVDEQVFGVADNLDVTYQELNSKIPGDAAVFILGYPQVFPATDEEQSCFPLRPFNDEGDDFPDGNEMDYLRTVGPKLEAVIADRAEEAGFHFVPVASYFAGHETCGADGEYLHAFTIGRSLLPKKPDNESFHPNPTGIRDGYGAALNDYIAEKMQTESLLPTGLPRAGGIIIAIADQPQAQAADAPDLQALEVAPAIEPSGHQITDSLVVTPAVREAGACADHLVPGETVSIESSGFAPGSDIEIVFAQEGMETLSDAISIMQTVADDQGVVRGQFALPSGVPSGVFGGVLTLGNSPAGGLAIDTGVNRIVDEVPSCVSSGPTIEVGAGVDGMSFPLGASVALDYVCLPGPEGFAVVTCDGDVAPGGSLYTGAPGYYTVRMTSTDEAGASATAEVSYTVESPFARSLDDFAVYGIHQVVIDRNTTIVSGDVGVHDIARDGVSVEIKAGSTLADPTSAVIADQVEIDRGAVVANVEANLITNDGTISGDLVQPAFLPPAAGLPAPPGGAFGGQNVVVPAKGSVTLAPGSYGDLVVGKDGTVTLGAGEYRFTSVNAGSGSSLLGAPTTSVVVAGSAVFGSAAKIGHPDGPLSVYAWSSAANAMSVGKNSTVDADLFALRGLVDIGAGSTVTGSLVGFDVWIHQATLSRR